MRSSRLGLLCLLALFCCMSLVGNAKAAVTIGATTLGIADEDIDEWSDPTWAIFDATGVKQVRHIVPWNAALRDGAGNPVNPNDLWEAHRWINAAKSRHLEILISFGIAPAAFPAVSQYREAVVAFRKEFPEIVTFTAWNEPNLPDPTYPDRVPSSNPARAAEYWVTLNQVCHDPSTGSPCFVVGGDFSDYSGMGKYMDEYKARLAQSGVSPAIWAMHPYSVLRTGKWAGFNEIFLPRTEGKPIWFTEVGGKVCDPTNGGLIDGSYPAAEANQFRSAQTLIDLIRYYNSRLDHVYYYALSAPGGRQHPCEPGNMAFDSTLLGKEETPRPAFRVIFPGVLQAPGAQTGGSSKVLRTQATLSGSVDPRGFRTTYTFEYGLTSAYGSSTPLDSAGYAAGGIGRSVDVTNLQPATTYHYRLAAANAGGTTYGEDRIFITQTRTAAVTRYSSDYDHWTTTGSTPVNWSIDGVLGFVSPTKVDGTTALYECIMGGRDRFMSTDPACEGQQRLDQAGWIYRFPSAAASVPLYRCAFSGSGEQFESINSGCEGMTVVGLLGYLRASAQLRRYVNPSGSHHVTSGPPVGGYTREMSMGKLLPYWAPSSHGVFGCQVTSNPTDYYLSRARDCEGNTYLGLEGYAYDSPPANQASQEIFRCNYSLGHFVSRWANCEGFSNEGSLGFTAVELPRIAFQANTTNLWTHSLTTGGSGPTTLGMMPGTSPAIASLATGGYAVAFQANDGYLWTYNTATGQAINTLLGMSKGSSPAIAAASDGTYRVAINANGNLLWTWSSANNVGTPTTLGTVAGTSPAMTMTTSGYAVAFHANGGNLWTYTLANGQGIDTKLGMSAGSSPAIDALPGSGFRVALNTYGNALWTYLSTTGAATPTTQMMAAGTSPGIATLNGGGNTAIVYQGPDTNLRVYTTAENAITNLQLGMAKGTSPAVAALPTGGYRIALTTNENQLWTWSSTSGAANPTTLGMAAGTSPSIAEEPDSQPTIP
jgi:hypothetical protein